MLIKNPNIKAFTLVEVVVGAAVFVLVATAVYSGFSAIIKASNILKLRIVATNLATERIENVRNMKYSDIGILNGIPVGIIPREESFSRSGINFVVTNTIRNIDDPADGLLGGTPNDTSPADSKLLEISVSCTNCVDSSPVIYSARVMPKNLENATNNGALFISVFDANGLPVTGANINVKNTEINPSINLNDTTDSHGQLQIIDAVPSADSYEIIASKSGYSTERTYKSGLISNPDPIRPHATVIAQNVTNTSLTIDKTSEMDFKSMNTSCVAVPNVDFKLEGSKLIGMPGIIKYSNSLSTDNSGELDMKNVEWDSYKVSSIDAGYDIIGLNPINPININPGIVQNISIIVAPKDARRLLVTVKEMASGLPLMDSEVVLSKSGVDVSKTTNRGSLSQTDWIGGNGQVQFTDSTKHFSDDGQVDFSNQGEIKLANIFGTYLSDGSIVSSSFDTGSASNFHDLLWVPESQNPLTGNNSIKFQFATSDDPATTTWNFIGPDGTASTYYTSANKSISSLNDGKRYFRYKLFMHTEDTTVTPIVNDISVIFTSDCTPPGQVSFGNLENGTYNITVSKSGYQSYSGNITMDQEWKYLDISLLQE